jgi:WD40 repeat protein
VVITPSNAHLIQRIAQFKARGEVVWLPDQTIIAVVGRKHIEFFDTRSLAPLPQQSWLWEKEIHLIATCPFSEQIVVVPWREYDIHLYDLAGSERMMLRHHDERNPIRGLTLSPYGTWLVSRGVIHSILWHMPTGKPVGQLPTQHQYAFSPDEKQLAGMGNGDLWLMDVATEQAEILFHYDILRAMKLVFSDTFIAACGDGYAPRLASAAATNNRDAIVNADLMQAYHEWQGDIEAFHQTFAKFSQSPVRLWNVKNRTELALDCTLGQEAWTLAFNPAGDLLVAGAGDSWSARNPLQVWNPHTQESIALLRDANQKTAANPPRHLSFSPDGTLLACDGGLSSQIELWGL